MFSLITTLSSMPVSAMPVNDTIKHPIHILIRGTSLKHQVNIRSTNEFNEKYSENSFLKNMSYSYRV